MSWYKDIAHIGYDQSGKAILKPNIFNEKSDLIDSFLNNANNSSHEGFWRTVVNPQTGQLVVLNDEDVQFIHKLASGKGALTKGEEDPYKPWEEYFSKNIEIMPVNANPLSKRSFIPHIMDKKRISRMVYAMKMGWAKPKLPSWLVDEDNEQDLRRYALYNTSGNEAAIDSDDEEDYCLGFPSSKVNEYIFSDVWSEKQQRDEEEARSTDLWRHALPPSLRGIKPQRPKPFIRPAAEPLPGHGISYNPPNEYLLNTEEKKQFLEAWADKRNDGLVNRRPPMLPNKFDSLRLVPFSFEYVVEREQRIKDLVMATRFEKKQVDTTPEALLPKIPSLNELRPYPNRAGIVYKGHNGRVTSIDVSPCGQWLASISPSDGCLRIWEIATNSCFRCYQVVETGKESKDALSWQEEAEFSVERPTALVKWNPNPKLLCLAAGVGRSVFIINPGLGDSVLIKETSESMKSWYDNYESQLNILNLEPEPKKKKKEKSFETNTELGEWSYIPGETYTSNSRQKFKAHFRKRPKFLVKPSRNIEFGRISIQLHQILIDLKWHSNGDYLATLTRSLLTAQHKTKSAKRLVLHRLSKFQSQSPFAEDQSTGGVEEWRYISFDPRGKPVIYLATSSTIRIFDLVQANEIRTLKLDGSSVELLSALAIHPSGDHICIGSFDTKFSWFDVEMGNAPIKKMRLGHGAIRAIDIHCIRPLTSIALDDGSLLIVHTYVDQNNFMAKPIIIPVQLIKAISISNPLLLNEDQVKDGVSRTKRNNFAAAHATTWHVRQPNVYSAHGDGSIRQFVPCH